MLILTINAGSSSLRLSLFEPSGVGWVRLAEAHYDDNDASRLNEFLASVDIAQIGRVVHRVVHGGTGLATPTLINARVEREIERLIPLAPLHNPVALRWMRVCRELLGEKIVQVALFDSGFYQSLPDVARHYALPRQLSQRYGIRRYGFHGIAHRAMWLRWRKIKPELAGGGRVISIQLGSGCSITAIKDGQVVDTSMGFSPLEGLVMATRSGDLDPGVVLFLQREAGLDVQAVEQLLSEKSGLLGVSGCSGDMRELLVSKSPDAQLAVELYCYRVRKYIGAYLAVLGGVDGVLIGGGVGENSALVREKIFNGMAWLGIALQTNANESLEASERCISLPEKRSEVWVIAVDEASVMVEEALALF